MRSRFAAAAAGSVAVLAVSAVYLGAPRLDAARPAARSAAPVPAAEAIVHGGYRPHPRPGAMPISDEALTGVVRRVCADCHTADNPDGGLSLHTFDVAQAAANPELVEKMIGKLRTGIMPPPDADPPGGDTLVQLVTALEQRLDRAAAANPNPGSRSFQRLNRAEYERSIRSLLGLEVDAGDWLPLDTKSANFDNIADVQTPSATLLDAYLDAASDISRLAIGDSKAAPRSKTYKLPRKASQWEQADGAPIGTRGGVAVTHTFPADGEYIFAVWLHAIPTGQLFGSGAPFDEKIEISVDGVRVATIDVDRGISQSDPNGMEVRAKPVQVKAGAHRISAAFLRTFEGPVNDNLAPIGHSIADTQIGAQYGVTAFAHLQDFVVRGPYNPTGISETPTRERIFSCRPATPADARPCAERIVRSLATAAYRRPATAKDVSGLLAFYDRAAEEGGFEQGVRGALEAILASPHFVFRIEEKPADARPGALYAIDDIDLASRLSYFIWGAPPDAALISVASRGGLSNPATLEAQARRLLADPRSEALATRFAAQWLRLQDIEKVHPDALQYPDFDQQLADAMRRETELFFNSLVRDNASVLRLIDGNYTYLNESLARHYGVRGVVGPEFRRVAYPDARRTGLLGHASVLTLTSHANRTSPVLRGKWVMEVLLGSPPPPPPPDVPDLDKTEEAKEGRLLTTRERMEMHRANPSCRSCHQMMDPIGLALDNFDVTGRWRIREGGSPVDTRGDFYDGTAIASPAELQRVLAKRPIPIVRNFTQNLMAYAIGRRVEHYDQPTIRRIAATAEGRGYRVADLIIGVVKSEPFRMAKVPGQ